MGKITVVDIVLRLLGAVIVGFAVGAQRARTSHPAGIRTHILVALGSCVVMVTSCIMYEQTIAVFGTTPSDPARLGAQVINGIGFLGAGAILREGFTVRGLTTAASVWVVACLGLSVGMGYYVLTAVGTVIAFVTLVAFDGIQEKIRTRRRPELDLQIECDHMGDIMVELSRLAERHFAKLYTLKKGCRIGFTDTAGREYRYTVRAIERLKPTDGERMVSEDWDLTLFTCTYRGNLRVAVRCTQEK